MTKKIKLEPDEKIASCLEGLFETFDGVQNIYFGDLILTNKRLYLISNKLINVEKSFWFSEERVEIAPLSSAFIVGTYHIKIKWIYKGDFFSFYPLLSKFSYP
ncbi:hypothetical protein [Oceanobacillus jeddahense]|uniref:GRAM domain-containing protein n=1 Tax=Oceanobacillus jeddahense TaxID=1462527 RepID=A0ABY5JWK8_9BACI|nr:hypothetical protein [Oceanobacillus jeddahense]UUI04768.1 hypothetical protein NP439_09075 [Oceanobacillus jeddahense]